MEAVQVKSLLTPVRGSMEDFYYADWNMNLYRGCSHGCIYCDSRSACYRIGDFSAVRPKADALPCWKRNCAASGRQASSPWAR